MLQVRLIAIGKNMPSWVEDGFETYSRRLSGECQLKLVELPLPKRTKSSNIEQIMQQESVALLEAASGSDIIIALDERGKQMDSRTLASNLQQWRENAAVISLLIGGPDGLAPTCFEHARMSWSLSKLTLPHPMIRIILAEQIYRAWSILMHHPYHR